MANNPTLLTMPIAENGQKNTIPATQAAAGDGLLSQSTGFPPETALPLGAGGKAPTREDFNGAFNLLSDIAFYSQKGWTFQYDENQAYYKGCIVMDATDGLRYECINDVAAGEILPSADTQNEYWREYSLANKAYRDLQNVTNVAYRRRPRKAFTLADLIAAVQTGNYNEYDIFPGDYYVGASGYTYIFAGDNPMKGTYTGYPITADHAGLIVDTHETCKWNDTNDTTGGYVSSVLHSYLVNTVLPKVKTDLGGVSHLCAHKKLYSTAITAGRYNRYGNNTGATSNWAWSDNQYIAALSEVQVYGSIVWSSSGYDTGEADQQLEVFRRFKHTEIFGDEYPWLRDVVSSSNAAFANIHGYANDSSASAACYAAGLICFH